MQHLESLNDVVGGITKLVIGRDPDRRLWPWHRSSGQKLVLLAPDIDLVEIGRAAGPGQSAGADLSGAVQTDQVVKISDESIERTFHAGAALLLPDATGQLVVMTTPRAADGLTVDIGVAQWAFDNGRPAGFGTDTLPGSEVLYLPLRAPVRPRGVLAVKTRNRRLTRIPEQRQLLDTFAALIAIALERVH